MTKVLVTGGSGRLGRYATGRLVELGHEVTDFDAVDRPWEESASVPFVKGDLTLVGDCVRALQYSEAEVIVHLAGIPYPTELHPGRSMVQRLPEDETMRVNTMGTYCILEAARRFNVRRVIFASTFYALGLGNKISDDPYVVEYLPIDEEHPLRPEDSYGLSKVFGEELLQTYARAYGISGVAFRLMGVDYPHASRHARQFGGTPEPRPDHKGGPLRTTHQYVDARDVANACALALDADSLEPFEAFYLSTDTTYVENTTDLVKRVWPDLVDLAAGIEGTDGIITDAKIRRKLGYVPQYSWRNGAAA